MKVVSDATMAHVMTNTSQLLPENAHDLLRQVEIRESCGFLTWFILFMIPPFIFI